MPSSIRSIFAAVALEPDGAVPWSTPVPTASSRLMTGVYVVARTGDVRINDDPMPDCPISGAALDELLAACPELRLDGARPDADALGARLAGFWLSEEPILYVGLAGPRERTPKEGELARRVAEYAKTQLGARSPHAGGWPLKTLSILDELVVHYAYCGKVDTVERAMLGTFAAGVSPAARARLHDQERVMPFANLEYPAGVRKRHGITGAKAPASPRPPFALVQRPSGRGSV